MVQETSREAYDDIQPTLGDRQQAVYAELAKHEDITNGELARELGWPINTVTPRVFELRKMHLVEEALKRPCSTTGRNAIAWRIIIKETLF